MKKNLMEKQLSKINILLNKKSSYPKHPDQLVVKKNEFFPEGVKEIDVFNYYTGIKNKLIPELKGRDLFVVMAISPGNELYLRHPYNKKTEFIRINSVKDFEKYHTGKTVEYHRTSSTITDEVVFDIDPGPKATFDSIKDVVVQCLDFIKKQDDFKGQPEVRYTGKRGFHITGYLKDKKNISSIKKDIEKRLDKEFKNSEKIVIATNKPEGKKVNIDLSPMKVDGGHIAPYSMRIATGLCCKPVSNLKNFDKEDAKFDKTYKELIGVKFDFNHKKKSNYYSILQEINKICTKGI